MKESKDTVKVKERGFLSIIHDLFRSLKLTISLLILLAILSIIGTLIAQNATRSEYVQRYGITLYEVLNFFDLFDMYHSWWFSAILLLLVINLVTCSLQRLPRILNQTFRNSDSHGWRDAMLKTMPYVERLPAPAREENVRSGFTGWFRNVKRIETDSEILYYAERGRFSRLGVP